MDHVHVLNHPLIQHKLSILRSKNTSVKEFRELVSEISALMCYEATRNLPMEAAEVETPIGMAKVQVLAGKKLAIVPILRAGLGMVDTMIDLIPRPKSATSACTGTRRLTSRWSTTARCPTILPSARCSSWTPCWPPAAAL